MQAFDSPTRAARNALAQAANVVDLVGALETLLVRTPAGLRPGPFFPARSGRIQVRVVFQLSLIHI